MNTAFVSLAFTPYLPSPVNTYLVLVGASDGSMTAFDNRTQAFVDYGTKKWCISGEIGMISCKNNSIIAASSSGTIGKYVIQAGNIFP